MNLYKFFNVFNQGGLLKGVVTAFVCMVLLMCTNACDRTVTVQVPDPALEKRALVWGEMRGQGVAFLAQEMTMLHPNSQRSQAARRKLLELDDVLRGDYDDKNSDKSGDDGDEVE